MTIRIERRYHRLHQRYSASFQSMFRFSRRSGDDRAPQESGFTLIELLVVSVVMPLVVGGIAAAIIATIQFQSPTATRLSNSSDSQILSAYYVRDVQSASLVTTDPSIVAPFSGTSPQLCGSSLGGTFLVGLYWGHSEATYWSVGSALDRRFCAVSNTYQTPSVSNVRAVSKNLVTGQVIALVTGSAATSAQTQWATTIGVPGIAIGVSEPGSGSGAYSYALQGTPLAWNSAAGGFPSGGSPPPPPLLLLGSTNPVLSCAGNGSIDVNGEVALNSTSNSAAVLLGNNSTATATSFYTADQADPGGALSGTGFTPSGPPASGPALTDPYQNLVPPSTSGLHTYTDGAYHGPGIYTTTLSLSGNSIQTFQSGIYILEQGMSVSGQAGIASAAGGVFFYVTGGQLSIQGQGGVNLQPLSSPPSPEASLVIWQVASDTNALLLTGNGSGTLVGGTIYAPGAQVGGSGNASMEASGIIAASLSCDGNGATTIG